MVYRAFSEVVAKAAFFVVTLIAARAMTREQFGVFSLGATVGWIAAVATDFGIQLHLARAVAQYPGRAAMLLHAWLRVRLWTAGVAVVAISVGLGLAGLSTEVAVATFLFTLVYLVSGLIEFLHYFYRGLERSDIESNLTLWQRLATLVCAVAVLWWRPVPAWLAIAMLLPVVATFAYSMRIASQLAWKTGASSQPDRVLLATPRGALSSVVPIGIGIVLSALYFRIDVFLVDAWQGTTAVALYNAVFRLVEALRLFPAAVLAVALPTLCRATSRRPVMLVSALLTAGALGVSAALWLSADRLIPLLYGHAYAEAVPAFRVLLLAFPLMSLNYALTHQLIGWHGHRAYAIACAAALIFNIALNTRLIPELGIEGAAWTTVWTEVLLTVCCAIALAAAQAGVGALSSVSEFAVAIDPVNPAVPS